MEKYVKENGITYELRGEQYYQEKIGVTPFAMFFEIFEVQSFYLPTSFCSRSSSKG